MATTIHSRIWKMQQSMPIWQRVGALLARSFATLRLWQQCHRGRDDLLGLNERMLRDIGLNRAEAEREAYEPCWYHEDSVANPPSV
jgi:uncharacterized protein YjiS (DUF1127 family)